jgi:CheY-like chemotaxis protein
MTMNDTVCQLNDFLRELKAEYSKSIASQTKRIMFLLDERNFIPTLSVHTDTEALKSVFGVLINNAIKYTDKGYIKAGYHVLENNVLQFFVEDTGNGFEPVILEEMTKYFASSENALPENMENLAGVNRLVKALDGKVRIDSQQGMGTTVYFSVDYKPVNVEGSVEEPQAEGAASQTRKEASPKARTNSMNNIWKGKTILIAEDEIVNYMFLEVLFEETGAILIHAADGRQAIDAVKANPNINIVLMDIKMPNINGLEATRQIKAIRPQLPVIAQTAYAMQDDEYKALQAGCNDYISKPIDANKLISLMKKYLW